MSKSLFRTDVNQIQFIKNNITNTAIYTKENPDFKN